MEQQMGGLEDRNVQQANQMQMQLADMHGEDLLEFIDKRAEAFRGIVNAHPGLYQEYERDPDATLKKIEPLLYH
jgi:hypothetical protein